MKHGLRSQFQLQALLYGISIRIFSTSAPVHDQEQLSGKQPTYAFVSCPLSPARK
jgi:hypothetical protein